MENKNTAIGASSQMNITIGINSNPFGAAHLYFTPSIEDIRIGYECELKAASGKWNSKVITENCNAIPSEWIHGENLRVPYLTKKQIEAEGWEFKNECFGNRDFFTKKQVDKLLGITYNYTTKRMMVEEVPRLYDIYNGDCKDINTFRYITKLLGI